MDLCHFWVYVHASSCPALLFSALDIHVETFKQSSFVPAMVIYRHHCFNLFTPLSVALTLVEGHRVDPRYHLCSCKSPVVTSPCMPDCLYSSRLQHTHSGSQSVKSKS